MTLLNREPLVANRRYQHLLPLKDPWDDLNAAKPNPLPKTICLPVISLDRRELAPWAALVAGEARARCSGRLLPATVAVAAPPEPAPATNAEGSAEEAQELWDEFTRQASPEARELLVSMAASPFLSLPVMRLLQAVEAPDAFAPQPLAEVLVSGLVRRLPGQEQRAAMPERFQFELLPAVHRLLQPRLGPQRRHQVLAAVTDLLERHWNRQVGGPSFRALLLGPKDELERDHPDLFHIANVTAAMLDQLPGQRFRELAEQLRAPQTVRPRRLWPEALAFQDEEFNTALLLPLPTPQTIRFSTAGLEELLLERITFPTARVIRQQGGFTVRHGEGEGWAFIETLQPQIGLTLVEIPAGRFTMGSPDGELERYADEGPRHEVELASFFMGQTPITQEQWRVVAQWQEREGERWGRKLSPNPSRFGKRPESDQRPVEGVRWLDAMEFCQRLSQRTGLMYTLPSEAQWEYACRAGTISPFAFGDTITPELANYDATYSYFKGPKGRPRNETTVIKTFPANDWGLYDMHGNVWEWCLDRWHSDYEGAPPDGLAWDDPEAGDGQRNKDGDEGRRLLRGGSWNDFPWFCRSAFRTPSQPVDANFFVGFRVVCLPQGRST